LVPTIPVTLLATEEFIDEPILPTTTEAPTVTSNKSPVEPIEDESDTNKANLDGVPTVSAPEVSSSSLSPNEGASVKSTASTVEIKSSDPISNPEEKSEDASYLHDSNPNPTAAPVEKILSLISGKEENISKGLIENATVIGAIPHDDGNLTSETFDSTSKEFTKESEKEEGNELQKKRVDEDPIPSYMEWAQKKQQELVTSGGQIGGQLNGPHGGNGAGGNHNSQAASSQNQSNRSTPVPATVTMNAKNFASPDCGAKVIESNPGTQNPSGVLSSSHDEYMLNK